MRVRDLIERKPIWEGSSLTEQLLEGPVYAKHVQNNKRLFDTRNNTLDHIEKYFDWEVTKLWPDFGMERRVSWSQYPALIPCTGCYIAPPREREP